MVQAATLTYFKRPVLRTWNTPGNWTSGVPTSTVSAYIGGVGGYTATSSAGGNAVTLYLGITSASGTNPNPTVLTGPGTLDLSAGTLTIANAAYFGYASTGTVTVSGGTLSCLGGGHTAAYIGGSAAGFSGVQGTVNVNAAASNCPPPAGGRPVRPGIPERYRWRCRERERPHCWPGHGPG